MAIINPSPFAEMMATRPSIGDFNNFSTAQREALAMGTQLGAQALESAAFLKGKQADYDYLTKRDKRFREDTRRASIINALTNGLGSVELIGAQRRNAGDALNAELLRMMANPNGMLDLANQSLAGLNQFRVGTLPWGAGGATTAGSILKSGGIG